MLAHLDSIRSLGPAFYPSDVVEAWSAGLRPDIYVTAMDGGEAFFVATGPLDGELTVLGFSTHRVDDAQDGASVYVRGRATRRGIGTLLLRHAEDHACAHGANSLQIQASLAGVEFYKANGLEELAEERRTSLWDSLCPASLCESCCPGRSVATNAVVATDAGSLPGSRGDADAIIQKKGDLATDANPAGMGRV